MNSNKYGHVGRPTNEEIDNRKKQKMLKVILILITKI